MSTYKTKVERQALLMKLVSPLALWTLGQIFTIPSVEKKAARFDDQANKQKARALRSMKRARKNAAANRGWLAAGVAAFAFGIGFLTRATKDR